jgi:hypothetical protein
VFGGVALAVLGEQLVPLLLESGTLGRVLAIEVVNLLGNGKALLRVEAELLLELLDVIGLERGAVDTVGALLKRTITNGGLELDKRGLVSDGPSLTESLLDALEVVVTVLDGDDVPAVSLVSLVDVLSEGNVGVTVNGDVVVIPDGNQVTELEVTSERAGFARDTLHEAAIAEEAVGVVVDEIETRLVEAGSGVSLGNGKTDSVGNTLAEGASGDLNARGVVSLGVAGGPAVHPSEGLKVIETQVIAEEVKEGILEHAAMAVGQNEAVTVEPVGVLGVELHELVEENVGNGSHAHGSTGVSRVTVEGSIGRQHTDAVDGLLIKLGVAHFASCFREWF